MNSPTVNLTCREWCYLRIGENALSENKAERLHALAELAARRLKLPETAVLTRTHRGLKAGQVVGILATSGMTLEILPKIDGDDGEVRKALVRMLTVTWGLPVADGELASLDTQRHDLLELLIRLFADRLLAAVRRGMPRRYLAYEEDLALLRGKLNVKRQLTHLAVRPDRLACRFDEFSEDTPLNRVFKAAVIQLSSIARSAANPSRSLRPCGSSPDSGRLRAEIGGHRGAHGHCVVDKRIIWIIIAMRIAILFNLMPEAKI